MLDIDGFRMDKGQQITVDAQGEFADHVRQCAKSFGKNNFFIPGEIVSGNAFGADYLGRGKTPDMTVEDTTAAVSMTTNNSDRSGFIRDVGKNAFDAACFHYTTYRSLTRFLGLVHLILSFPLTDHRSGWTATCQQKAITPPTS